ncbi:MAG: hypothetical protein ACKPB4_09770 [Sphaerospermopsis kisseleviana]
MTFAEFVYLRDEIRGHHEIINHRMSWFAATQSLMYGAYATAAAAAAAATAAETATKGPELKDFYTHLIPGVGIILCILMVPSVESAIERIRALRRVLKADRTFRHKKIYPINSDLSHWAALLYPRLATFVFLVSWGFLFRA